MEKLIIEIKDNKYTKDEIDNMLNDYISIGENVFKKIKDNAYDRTIQYIENIKNNINEENIDKILSDFDNNIISIDMKKLLKMYLLERRKRMLEIYNLKDEV